MSGIVYLASETRVSIECRVKVKYNRDICYYVSIKMLNSVKLSNIVSLLYPCLLASLRRSDTAINTATANINP